jgi:hypothetical protein
MLSKCKIFIDVDRTSIYVCIIDITVSWDTLMPLRYKSVRLPKNAPQAIRDQFVAMAASSRFHISPDQAIASIKAQVDRVGLVRVPVDACAGLHQLVEPYVVTYRRPNKYKQKPPQA